MSRAHKTRSLCGDPLQRALTEARTDTPAHSVVAAYAWRMRRDAEWARARFARARVARLATVRADGTPRIVPIAFAVAGGVLLTAVDHKPKSTTRLGRLTDIEGNPDVSVLVDQYSDDWSHLWWARADGRARVEKEYDVGPLVEKYADQYLGRPPAGPVIVVEVDRWSGWSAT